MSGVAKLGQQPSLTDTRLTDDFDCDRSAVLEIR
jgi:hypothetical protein